MTNAIPPPQVEVGLGNDKVVKPFGDRSLILGSSPDSFNHVSVIQKMSISFDRINSLMAARFFLQVVPTDCALNTDIEILDCLAFWDVLHLIKGICIRFCRFTPRRWKGLFIDFLLMVKGKMLLTVGIWRSWRGLQSEVYSHSRWNDWPVKVDGPRDERWNESMFLDS